MLARALARVQARKKAHPALRHLIIAPEAGNETKSVSVRIKMKMRLCELSCVVLCASLLKVTEPLSFVRKSFARFLRISNQAAAASAGSALTV